MIGLSLLAAAPVLAALYFGFRAYRFRRLNWPEHVPDAQLLTMATRYLQRRGWQCAMLHHGTAFAAQKAGALLLLVPIGGPSPAQDAERAIVIALSIAPLTPESVADAAASGMFALYYKDLAGLGALADTTSASLQDFLTERSYAESQPRGVEGWSQEAVPESWSSVAQQAGSELGGTWTPSLAQEIVVPPSAALIPELHAEEDATEIAHAQSSATPVEPTRPQHAAAPVLATAPSTIPAEPEHAILAEPKAPETTAIETATQESAKAQDPASGRDLAGTIRASLEAARHALAAKQLDAAEQSFRAVLTADPAHVGALGGLAAALNQMGRIDEAIGTAQAALRAAPKSVRLMVQLGNLFNRREAWTAAQRCFEQALELDPNNVPALAALATAEARLGQPDAALAALQRAICQEPSSVRLHVQRGQILLAEARLEEAEAAFRQACTAEPANPGAWNGLLSALREQNKTQEAVAFLETQVAAHPEDGRWRARLRQMRQDTAG